MPVAEEGMRCVVEACTMNYFYYPYHLKYTAEIFPDLSGVVCKSSRLT